MAPLLSILLQVYYLFFFKWHISKLGQAIGRSAHLQFLHCLWRPWFMSWLILSLILAPTWIQGLWSCLGVQEASLWMSWSSWRERIVQSRWLWGLTFPVPFCISVTGPLTWTTWVSVCTSITQGQRLSTFWGVCGMHVVLHGKGLHKRWRQSQGLLHTWPHELESEPPMMEGWREKSGAVFTMLAAHKCIKVMQGVLHLKPETRKMQILALHVCICPSGQWGSGELGVHLYYLPLFTPFPFILVFFTGTEVRMARGCPT